ncbi:MAG: hypothetical protein GX452_00940 [Ignavibacteriales bacterium]|jgi:hypothetical protein|nr:hypothetical protein [Ignavibacteriaceae bacterium]NLH59952.1 hypothetical protein [Ignavibacteriales bacterium]HOJ18083.1 hypothetical protein [Ignavibacteriaceae bacterium]HPO56613.1 hypothetical protein [Ignavibacteriaceae bacterium]
MNSFHAFQKLCILFLIINFQAFAQLGQRLGLLDEYDVVPYLIPIVTALSNAANTGTGYKTEIDKEMEISIALKGFAMYPTGSERIFKPAGYGGISGGSSASILGQKGTVFSGSGGLKYTYPDGYNINMLSHLMLFISASYEHMELYLKIFPQLSFADENILLTSLGIRANVNQFFFKRFPFDLTLGISSSNFNISDYLKSTNFAFSAQVGETYGKLSLYANIIYEMTRGSVNYYIPGDINSANPLLKGSRYISKNFKGKNSLGTVLGISLKYEFITLCGEYTIARNNVMTAGFLYSF